MTFSTLSKQLSDKLFLPTAHRCCPWVPALGWLLGIGLGGGREPLEQLSIPHAPLPTESTLGDSGRTE